jgi:MFS family permease
MPILPFYAEGMGATVTTLGLLFSVFSIVQFFFSPMWGQISDRIGRRLPILAGISGLSLPFFLIGLLTRTIQLTPEQQRIYRVARRVLFLSSVALVVLGFINFCTVPLLVLLNLLMLAPVFFGFRIWVATLASEH